MFVYKYVFNEEVIYVGITKDLESRLSIGVVKVCNTKLEKNLK